MSGPSVQFDHPLLLLGAAAAVIVWVGPLRRRSILSKLLRSAAVVLLAVAISRPRVFVGGAPVVGVFADISASQATPDGAAAVEIPRSMRTELYVFAAEAGRAGEGIDTMATSAGAVLATICDHRDQWAAAVVFTDGRFTDAADRAQAIGGGCEIILVPRAPAEADARVVGVTVDRSADRCVTVAAVVAANRPMTRTVRIARAADSTPLAQRSVRLAADAPVTLRVRDEAGEGPLAYRVEIIEPDLLTGNNVWVAPVPSERSAVLWIAPDAAAGPIDMGSRLVRQVRPAAMDLSLEELMSYSAVVLVDGSGTALTPQMRERLARYVRLGGGLVCIGSGPYASPADRADPLNRVLPLTVGPCQRKRIDVTLLLDASASMAQPAAAGGGERKFDLVRQATMLMARRELAEGDRLRVITFTGKAIERFDEPVSDAGLDRLATVLANVRPVGGTRITGALGKALAEPGGRADRLVLVLSDLETETFDPARWARKVADASAALAVVAVGPDDDAAPLKRLARSAGGRFILRGDLVGVADVFADLVRTARGETLIRRRSAVRPIEPRPGLLPLVDAFLAATPRDGCEVLAVTDRDEPIFARRSVGTGRCVQWVAPLQWGLNREWVASPAAVGMLAEAIAWSAGPEGDRRFTGRIERDGSREYLVVEAVDQGRPMNGLSLTSGEIELSQVAPGRYRGALVGEGPAMHSVQLDAGPTVLTVAQAGGYRRELTGVGVDAAGVESFARAVGGRVVQGDELGDHLRTVRDRHGRRVWPALVLAALLAVLADWLFGRGRYC